MVVERVGVGGRREGGCGCSGSGSGVGVIDRKGWM